MTATRTRAIISGSGIRGEKERALSDVPQGDGWWIASDGKWYPPHLHPDKKEVPPPLPAPMATVPAALDEVGGRVSEHEPKVELVSQEELDALFAEAGVAAAEQVHRHQPEPGMWRGTAGFVPPPDGGPLVRNDTDEFFAKASPRRPHVRKEGENAQTSPPARGGDRSVRLRARMRRPKP